MKRKEQSVLLAGLLALGLAACTSPPTNGDASTITSETSGEAAYSTPPVGSADTTSSTSSTADTGATGSTSATGGSGSMAGTGSGSVAGATGDTTTGTAESGTAATGTPNSVVTLIEVVPRQSGASSTGAGTTAGSAVGGSGTAGTTGSTGDRVYRVTLRLDDGSTRVVTQEWAPAFRTGDRVRLEGGAIQR